ncbi:uncharacterized protein PGTG_10656 [Puccinia graminis f. sp. tritici CRL 75-36-700-3]|uniref:Uncharacterized protein n=1 Tax=Puccinia graminis f. sp. tritici (strain CRL 75-36-700-3 / race SCCL) TaxID=418459 RepID=E3KJ03_PUCGT|nr:uncharacterized protein PGTG_10656 [Puccinia graminis f. sp. tritici CRL 75-36-700-3]EFP84278.2 hypothetical protein PGTG_10656 [Puccinia graminis f. sp. tritici CRL 75-36-700-3]
MTLIGLTTPPAEATDAKPIVRTERGWNLEDFCSDWDHLSDTARSTIKLTLSVDLSIRYRNLKPASKLYNTICEAYEKNTRARRLALEDAFWTAKHDPNIPIAKWIARIRNAATGLATVKLTRTLCPSTVLSPVIQSTSSLSLVIFWNL